MYKRGVVVGKFYPFHKGHQYLVETGLKGCDHLTVFVCDNPAYRIPAEIRANWIRAIYPEAHVRVIADLEGHNDNSQIWAAYTIEQLGYVPDVVFTSEDYGIPYARYMGSEHVLVDYKRLHVPCSGTMIRSDPWAHPEFLHPLVRAYFVKRIALVGAESTGTTTTARLLAAHFHSCWVPEYGRFYWEGKQYSRLEQWDTDEFIHIALMQAAAEEHLARHAYRGLFCDTDPMATGIWHRHYLHNRSRAVEDIAAKQRYDLYLITDTDIPLEQDGTRDADYEARSLMHRRFIKAVKATGIPYAVLSGSLDGRMSQAIRLCEQVLAYNPVA